MKKHTVEEIKNGKDINYRVIRIHEDGSSKVLAEIGSKKLAEEICLDYEIDEEYSGLDFLTIERK